MQNGLGKHRQCLLLFLAHKHTHTQTYEAIQSAFISTVFYSTLTYIESEIKLSLCICILCGVIAFTINTLFSTDVDIDAVTAYSFSHHATVFLLAFAFDYD